jgi:5-methylcytosine-specific restriction endonuclease McrA|tara:strand:- start:363 stop:767 length:405 start_codon:yes stop_codon:yes gene_type:complete
MIGIAIIGIGLMKVLGKNNNSTEGVNILNNFIKILPIDNDTKSLVTPFISHKTNPETKIMNSGKQSHKRSVSETKKKFVAAQQKWKCGDCGDQLTAWFEVDHKHRLDRGGNNEISNLLALCRNCHGKKTALENM